MKCAKKRWWFLMFMVIGLGLTPLCAAETAGGKTSIEQVERESRELMQALKAYTVEQRAEAIQKSKAAVDHLDKRINALETRIDNNWDKMDKAARAEARASLQALRKQRTEVAEWYGSLKGSSVDAWGHMKKGFADAYRDLNEAWQKSEKEFGSDK